VTAEALLLDDWLRDAIEDGGFGLRGRAGLLFETIAGGGNFSEALCRVRAYGRRSQVRTRRRRRFVRTCATGIAKGGR